MAANTYQCTECGAILKSPQALPAGKKIRCPKCNEVFTIPEASGAPAPKPQAVAKASPVPAKKATRSANNDEDEGGSYVFKQETFTAAPTDAELTKTKRKLDDKRKSDDDDEDDADDDDRDDDRRAKKKKKGFKKKKQSSGSGSSKTIALIIVGILLFLLLAGGGAGAYLYLNWYKNKGTGKEDPLALLPVDCNTYFHIDLGALSTHPVGASLVDLMVKRALANESIQSIKIETGMELKDLMDQIYVGTKTAPGQKVITSVLFKSRIPFDQNKMRLAFKDSTPERFKWKTYFKLKDSKGLNLVYMASDHFILFSDAPEATLQAVIESNHSQPSIPGELISLIQTMDQENAWGVAIINETMRKDMKNMNTPGAMPQGMNVPAGVEAGLAKAKAAGIGGFLAGSQFKFTVSVDCADEASARKLSDGSSDMWNKQKAMLSLAATMFGKSGSVLVKDLTQTLHFASKGPFAQASAQVSADALKGIIMETSQMSAARPGAAPAGNRGGGGGRPGGRGGS